MSTSDANKPNDKNEVASEENSTRSLHFIEQIIENEDKRSSLPPFVKILSAGAGFFSGILIVAILMYCFIQTPFLSKFSSENNFRDSSGSVLMAAVHTVNILSFQSVTLEAEKDLKSLQILPSDNVTGNPKSEGKTVSADSKNVPSESGKKAADEQKTTSEPKKDAATPIDDFDF